MRSPILIETEAALRCEIQSLARDLAAEAYDASGTVISVLSWLEIFKALLGRYSKHLSDRKPDAAARIWRSRAVYLASAMTRQKHTRIKKRMVEVLWAQGEQGCAWSLGADVIAEEALITLDRAAAAALDKLWNRHGHLSTSHARRAAGETHELSGAHQRIARTIASAIEATEASSSTGISTVYAAARRVGKRARAEATAQWRAEVYAPWVDELRRRNIPLDMVLGVVVYGRPLYAIVAPADMEGAALMLRDALDLYEEIAAAAKRTIRRHRS